ncbi:hypothetical protein EYF80_032508 [Liparis tanakae]|uniref:Uncharacterized protein n=1 Tax=Liparis tanakae TaxID=230148 RepID=A0A4Z2GUY1_9TELE|nr:hypothetical protein EYF80_032508 [Liparis tanakae]
MSFHRVPRWLLGDLISGVDLSLHRKSDNPPRRGALRQTASTSGCTRSSRAETLSHLRLLCLQHGVHYPAMITRETRERLEGVVLRISPPHCGPLGPVFPKVSKFGGERAGPGKQPGIPRER